MRTMIHPCPMGCAESVPLSEITLLPRAGKRFACKCAFNEPAAFVHAPYKCLVHNPHGSLVLHLSYTESRCAHRQMAGGQRARSAATQAQNDGLCTLDTEERTFPQHPPLCALLKTRILHQKKTKYKNPTLQAVNIVTEPHKALKTEIILNTCPVFH